MRLCTRQSLAGSAHKVYTCLNSNTVSYWARPETILCLWNIYMVASYLGHAKTSINKKPPSIHSLSMCSDHGTLLYNCTVHIYESYLDKYVYIDSSQVPTWLFITNIQVCHCSPQWAGTACSKIGLLSGFVFLMPGYLICCKELGSW